MDANCPRCKGLLNQQWNVELRQYEAHCITCGNLPGIRLRRGDGRELGAPRYCEVCNLRPVARLIPGPWTPLSGELELAYCAGCREQINRKARMKARWEKEQGGRFRKAG